MGQQKRVCIIHAYPSEFTIKSAAEYGYKVVLVHPDPQLSKQFAPFLEAEIITPLDDDEHVLGKIEAYHQKYPFTVMLPANEVTLITVAKVAARLGLTGNTVAAAMAGRDKFVAAKLLLEKGVPTPRTVAIHDPWQGQNLIARELGYPAIIKIADSMNSQGVIKVRNKSEYLEQIGQILELLDEPANINPVENRNRIAYGRSETPIIAQEFIRGCEVNIDLIMDGQNCIVAGLFEKDVMNGPYFTEKASMSPAQITDEEANLLERVATDAARALGATIGSAHVEIRLDPEKGPYVIEVGLRPGGGLTMEMVEYITQGNIIHILLDLLSGDKPLPQSMPKTQKACLYGGISYPMTGKIDKITGMETFLKIDGLLFYKTLAKVGDNVQALPKSAQPHFCYYAIGGQKREDVLSGHQALQRSISLKMSINDPFSLDEKTLNERGRQVLDVLAEAYVNSENRPAYNDVRNWKGLRQESFKLPGTGSQDLEAVFEDLFHNIFNGYSNFVSPCYMAYFGPRPHPVTVLGDLIASALNQAPGAWRAGPTSAQLEIETLGWLGQFMGYPIAPAGDPPNGIVTGGGSMANATALKLARDQVLGLQTRDQGLYQQGPFAIYVSDDVHFSITRAVDLLGFGHNSLRTLPFGEGSKPDKELLSRLIKQDREDGLVPLAIVVTAGTTGSGFVEPIDLLADVAEETGLWLHVDGASGGAYANVSATAHMFKGIERADSVTVDPCKWLMTSFGIGCLLVKDGKKLWDSFNVTANYFQNLEEIDTVQMGFRGTRGWRSLGLWLLFKHLGEDGIKRHLLNHLRISRALAGMLEFNQIKVLKQPTLPICCFRVEIPDLTLREQNDFNQRLLLKMNKSGEFYLSSYTRDDTFYLRSSIDNYTTHPTHVTTLVNSLMGISRELKHEMASSKTID